MLKGIEEQRQEDKTDITASIPGNFFDAISSTLEIRFGSLHLMFVYQNQLKTIVELISSISTGDTKFCQQFYVQHFIDGVKDYFLTIEQRLKLERCK